mmetsp:Transcript_6127/g.13514  ORF Transcript_6127/g.13514 Transcript_6127/m.13514 type:complete len:200 (+) Transcript_6127:1390-1989(+)
MTVLTTFLRSHATTRDTYLTCAETSCRDAGPPGDPVHTCCTPRALPPTVTTADQPGAHSGQVHIGHEACAPNIRSHTRVLKDSRQAMRSQPQQPPHRTRRCWRVDSLRASCTLIDAICCARRATRPMQPILQQILEIVSSHELFARRLPSSADTLHSVSTSRRCSSGAAASGAADSSLAVLQLQRADTPECVSASLAAL